ncbi:type II toxin-antitoxin system RelE/ParE family toxin [Kitasatospora sp. NPDC001547]|uniref:type II toxin-antitoxin system RelE/ParE family toxin n=1 Tax=Kitasatospora sp. NPDC001547 TaxID=3364015 RepID=UPI0036A70501|nr:type II toxin-antitoxin system RelE/ParE family toxin [Kitasatospora sp. Xyl93]
MWEITLLAPVEEWYLQVCEDDPKTAENILEALDLLADEGPTLGRPAVDRIHRSRLHNLKELRPGSSGASEVRMLFVFDQEREAIILVAGDKSGRWSEWYDESIPLAEMRYADYVEEQRNGARR